MSTQIQSCLELEAAFCQLDVHLRALQADPGTPQDADLLKTVRYVVRQRPGDTIPVDQRVKRIINMYHSLHQLPSPSEELLSLLSSLMDSVPVHRLLDIEPPIDFVAGLNPNASLYNHLTLDLLINIDEQSAQSLATHFRPMFEALIKLWLTTSDIGISSKAESVLLNLIIQGQEAGRKRFFRDSDVYGLIFKACHHKGSLPLDKNARSIAQARLLSFMVGLSTWNWSVAIHSHDPQIEAQYGLEADQGLMDFATRHSTDFEADVILHRTLIQTFSELLRAQKYKTWTGQTSPALQFLTSRGLHQATMTVFLNPKDPTLDPIDVQLLYHECAVYAATFVDTHPNLIAADPQVREPILDRLQASFSSANWLSPAPDLNVDLAVFTKLPRICLNTDMPSLLQLVPYHKANPEAITNLAQIFHGPENNLDSITMPGKNSQSLDVERERQLARKLYEKYSLQHVDLLSALVSMATKPVLPAVCTAAIGFMHALVTAEWDEPLASVSMLMNDDRSRNSIVAFLLAVPQPPQSVETRGGSDTSARIIAEARYNLVDTVAQKLKKLDQWHNVEHLLRQRLSAGIWGRPTNLVATVGQ